MTCRGARAQNARSEGFSRQRVRALAAMRSAPAPVSADGVRPTEQHSRPSDNATAPNEAPDATASAATDANAHASAKPHAAGEAAAKSSAQAGASGQASETSSSGKLSRRAKRSKRKRNPYPAAYVEAIACMKQRDADGMWDAWQQLRQDKEKLDPSQCLMMVAGFLGACSHHIAPRAS